MDSVVFAGTVCALRWGRYSNGRLALQLREADTGAPVATASVHVPEAALAADELVIKNYSENAGILGALVEAGVVAPTGRSVRVGMVMAPVARVLDGAGRALAASR